MNKTQIDKQFDLIVEDFYDDEAVEYPTSSTGRSDVLLRKLALYIIVAMAVMFVAAYIIQNPITIPAAIIAVVTFIVYRNMVKDYAKKKNA